MTLREIAALHDAARARETQTDFYTARIVAMLAAVNSKNHKFEPRKWMIHKPKPQAGDDIPQKPLTAEQVIARFRQLGVGIIDKRSVT